MTRTAAAADLPGARLSVSRGAGAETCPDADALAEELSRRIAPENAPPTPLDLSVDVAREGDAFVAAIHVEGRKHGERVLRAEGPACDALHDALVVMLLVLLDEERAATAPVPGAATIPSTPPAAPPGIEPSPPQHEAPAQPAASAPQQAEKARQPPTIWIAAGGGATVYGVPVTWSGVLLGDLAVRLGAFEVSAGSFWVAPRTITAPPGHVTVNSAGGRARGCYALTPEHTGGTRLLGCAQGMYAALTGEASDVFTGHASATRDWWLAGGSAEATYPLTPRLDVGISFSVLATLGKRESFTVNGLKGNPVFDSGAVVGIAAARLEARFF